MYNTYSGVRVRISYTYRTPYQSIGTEGVRYTSKNLILGAEMVRSTGCFFKIEYGYGYGKNLVKNHGTEYGTYTGCLWKAKYGYGINYGTYTGFRSIYKSNLIEDEFGECCRTCCPFSYGFDNVVIFPTKRAEMLPILKWKNVQVEAVSRKSIAYLRHFVIFKQTLENGRSY